MQASHALDNQPEDLGLLNNQLDSAIDVIHSGKGNA